MNLLLVEASEIRKGRVRLTDRRAEHLLRVLRVETGRTVRIGRIGGAAGEGRVVAVDGDAVEIEVDLEGEPAPRPSIDLVVALPRPQALKRILQYAAAMRVGRIDFINAWRVEKSFFQSPLLEPAALRRHLLLGAEQGATTWLPEVRFERRFVASVKRLAETPENPRQRPLRLLAHPEAADPIETVLPSLGEPERRVELALGPEGGWIDREVDTFRQAGFHPVTLGPWILRVETALAAALAQLELLRRTAGRRTAGAHFEATAVLSHSEEVLTC